MKRNIFFVLCTLTTSITLQASSPLGLLQPYNFAIQPDVQEKKSQFTTMFEYGFKTTSYDIDGNQVNALQIYEPAQDALALFQGFEDESQFAQSLNAAALGFGSALSENSGLYTPTGDLTGMGGAIGYSYMISNGITARAYLPIYHAKLSNVSWKYAGDIDGIFSDANLQNGLLSDLETDVKNLFDLSIGNWSETGIGDLAFLIQWQANFPQYRKALNNVQPCIHFGLELPTGKKINQNIVAMPAFGNDGAITIPFGAGLNLRAYRRFEFIVNSQFWYVLGSTRSRRVKTFEDQTTLLLPAATETYKETGLTQNFNLGLKVYLPKGLFARFLYDYKRKSEDIIFSTTHGASAQIMQTKKSLEEISHHYLMFSAGFDSAQSGLMIKGNPQVHLFARLPFNGSLINGLTTCGVQIALEF